MNVNLVKINDNLYGVSDEDGNINMLGVNKEGKVSDDKIVHLLELQNRIEDTGDELNQIPNELENTKTLSYFAWLIHGAALSLAAIMYRSLSPELTMYQHLYISVGPFCIVEALNIICTGTILTRYLKKKRLTKTRDNILFEIDKLKSEYQSLKNDLGVIKEKEELELTVLKPIYAYKASNNESEKITHESIQEIHKSRVLKIR